MRVDEFDYELPPELIAQEPAPQRDGSRLLLLDRATGETQHRGFSDVGGLLAPGDLLVVNDTRVVPARLVGRKPSGGRVELLLLEREEGERERWRSWLRASRKPEAGVRVEFEQGLTAEVLGREGDVWRVELSAAVGEVGEAIERVGQMPLPPYIRRENGRSKAADRERYQTVYARRPGAVAAPTAGLHFTPRLLESLSGRDVEIASLTLHVGPGTFQPVRSETVEDHRMHAERYELAPAVADSIESTRRRGGRIVAVGTTVVRVLEGCAAAGRSVAPGTGECSLFIFPGYHFNVVDALITNFHLPRSTLLMLVCAFAGRERLLAAYREAVRKRYRFFSYGDAMMLV